MDNFNPALAVRRLQEVAAQLEQINDKIIVKRSECVMLECALLDAKAAAREGCIRDGMNATMTQQTIEYATVAEKKALLVKEAELKNMQDMWRTVENVNANHKLSIKLRMAEMGNLNLQP